ncbi:MAG: hypothetical protein ACREAS_09040 [Nitrososphaera sp.]
MTVTSKGVIVTVMNSQKISRFDAMRKRMREIVVLEGRPFSFVDFRSFEVDGKQYELKHGVIRNYLSKLTKSGEITFSFNTGAAYYTLPGKNFTKQNMTATHVEGTSYSFPLILQQLPIKNTPIYRWLKNRRFEKQALHDIRLTFGANGIWTALRTIYPNLINSNNQDLQLPSLTFFEYLDIGITIHHTDTVSISIGCSFRPIALDAPDLLQLIEALTRVEVHLTNEINKLIAYGPNVLRVSVPRYTTWIVKMWHFGVDTLDEYDKKEFHITFEEGISDLIRIYTKRTKNKKLIVRAERQEYPNEDLMLALVKKLYPDGQLINTER